MSPSGTASEPLRHSFFGPPFAAASVSDAMRVGVLSCPADTPLRDVARMMALNRIHAVVVSGLDDDRPWGVVSDLDLVAVAADLDRIAARDVASTELVTVRGDEPLARAAQVMVEHELAHLVVVAAGSGHPVGVLSTLDVAGALAWGD